MPGYNSANGSNIFSHKPLRLHTISFGVNPCCCTGIREPFFVNALNVKCLLKYKSGVNFSIPFIIVHDCGNVVTLLGVTGHVFCTVPKSSSSGSNVPSLIRLAIYAVGSPSSGVS